jgi:hypothetical protein
MQLDPIREDSPHEHGAAPAVGDQVAGREDPDSTHTMQLRARKQVSYKNPGTDHYPPGSEDVSRMMCMELLTELTSPRPRRTSQIPSRYSSTSRTYGMAGTRSRPTFSKSRSTMRSSRITRRPRAASECAEATLDALNPRLGQSCNTGCYWCTHAIPQIRDCDNAVISGMLQHSIILSQLQKHLELLPYEVDHYYAPQSKEQFVRYAELVRWGALTV